MTAERAEPKTDAAAAAEKCRAPVNLMGPYLTPKHDTTLEVNRSMIRQFGSLYLRTDPLPCSVFLRSLETYTRANQIKYKELLV